MVILRRKAWSIPVVAAALFFAATGSPHAAGTPAAASGRPPVVVLLLDEFPTTALIDRHSGIDENRFPHFAQLAREAVWYPNHTTVSSVTYNSIPAMLTGNMPLAEDTFPVVQRYPQNLFPLLSAGGYRIDGREPITELCPVALCPLRSGPRPDPTMFGSSVELVRAQWDLNAASSRGKIRGELRRIAIRPRTLIFRHLLLPHHPYQFLPSGQVYRDGPIPKTPWGEGRISNPIGNARLGYQRMMLQAGYVDRIIGAFRRNAIRQHRWKSMMLVVVGDHGVEHRPGRYWRNINRANVGSIAFTPLFVKYPGSVKGGMSLRPTQGIDVLPTIARTARVGIPAVQGRPVWTVPADRRPVTADGRSFPLGRALASRNEAVEYRDRLLGTGGFYRMGPARHLIGRETARTPATTVNARLDDPEAFTAVRLGARRVPAMVTGRVTGVREGQILLVSVNGVIRGTAEVFRDRRKLRFGAMIDPAHLLRRNWVSIYRLPDPTPTPAPPRSDRK